MMELALAIALLSEQPAAGVEQHFSLFAAAESPVTHFPLDYLPVTPLPPSDAQPPPVPSPDEPTRGAPREAGPEGPIPKFAPPPKPNKTRMVLVTTGVLIGASFEALKVSGKERQPFHFTSEDFFGKHTYAGGADKASHFVFYNGLSRELGVAYSRMGYSRDRAILMGAGVALVGGVLVEVADGLNRSGYAWEDLLMDSLGAGTAAAVTYYGLDDVLGFRFGKISADEPSVKVPGAGKDYSEEIYTGDLKLAGAARRLGLRPGLLRFFLLSMTYGSNGYRYSLPEYRERNIGGEIGINFPQILTEIGVRDTTWWGRVLYIFFNFVRVPYTQIGFHYDLNQKNWHGPDFGQQAYDPGP